MKCEMTWLILTQLSRLQLAAVLRKSIAVLSSLQAVECCYRISWVSFDPALYSLLLGLLLYWLLQVRPFVRCWPQAPTKKRGGITSNAAADLVNADATQIW